MRKEKNHRTLQRAIHKLPEYDTSDANWARILVVLEWEGRNSIPVNFQQIQPPDEIWEKIDHNLNSKEQPVKKLARIPLWIAVAAAIFALLFLVLNPFRKENSKLIYDEEWIPSISAESQWSQNDSMLYHQISQVCRLKPQVCKSDEFSRLKHELEFLDDSKQTILDQLNKYDTDRDLENILSQIEIERLELLNKMKNLIN